MNTQDIISSGIIESYVLGTASPEEVAMLGCMQQSFPEIKAAVLEAQQALERMASHLAVTPSAGLKEKIWDRIEAETAATNTDPDTTKVTAAQAAIPVKAGKSIAWKGWAMAASVLLILSIAANIYYNQDNVQKERELAAITAQKNEQALKMAAAESRIAMLNQPDMKVVRLKGAENHTTAHAMVFWNEQTKEVYLDAAALPKAPSGKQYQLWAMVNGKPVDAGLYTSEAELSKALSTIPQAEAFAITLENAGGSPVPTLSQLYVIGTVS